MQKSPISILQEHAVQLGGSVLYTDQVETLTNKFQCTCTFNGKSASATALSKKSAKHLAAVNLLKQFGFNNKFESSLSFCNYIGELKEYCDKVKGISLIFTETQSVNCKFTWECQIIYPSSEVVTAIGEGYTKQDAKQSSAHNMMKIIKDKKDEPLGQLLSLSPQRTLGVIPKTPTSKNYVSELKEYCDKNRLNFNLTDLGSLDNIFVFEIQLDHGKLSKCCARGIGHTKKEAKQNCCHEMIKILHDQNEANNNASLQENLISFEEVSSATPKLPTIESMPRNLFTNSLNYTTSKNAISKLNEYCAKHKYSLPKFMETGFIDGMFVFKCCHQSLITEGKSPCKKGAKLESAEKMLELVQDPMNIIIVEDKDYTKFKIAQNEIPDSQIVDIFEKSSVVSKLEQSESVKLEDENKNTTNRIVAMEKELADKGLTISLHLIQESPCMISLQAKSNGQDMFTLMEMGNSYNQVHATLLERALIHK